MKKENILIGAIAVIGLLTLFNTYKILSPNQGKTIPLPVTTPANQINTTPITNQGDNFPQPIKNSPPQFKQDIQAAQVNEKIAKTPKTRIAFKQNVKDFGKVLSTSANKHSFVFTNTGTEPLIIFNAKGSCGCTVPKWSKEPIQPGETGKIDVVYSPKGQSGKNQKTVTVTANTDPANTVLTVSGDIKKVETKPKQGVNKQPK